MLLQLVLDHPSSVVQIVAQTPAWVWGLLAGLLVLGISQLRDRRTGLPRVSITPLAMTAFSLWGTASAFAASPLLPQALAAWLAAAALLFALIAPGRTTARYDAGTRTYAMAGSAAPLLLILGIFSLKYVVGVELHLAPQHLQEAGFLLGVAALYGAFSGIFLGRAARLWRLALRSHGAVAPA